MPEKPAVSRRTFLKVAGTAMAAAAFSAKSYAQIAGANNRLRMAFIGCGGIASHHLEKLLAIREAENLDIAAVCDVYRTRALEFQQKTSAAGAGTPQLLAHHEDVLALKDVDYVLIATPEHAHARLTLDALDAGKHVYCEKPLTHRIREGQAVVKKARETGLKLQVGVQGMADDSYSSANAAIRAGKLGPVVEAQIDYVRNYPANQGPWRKDIDPNMPKPDDLDWNEWLEPAHRRPWDPHRYFEWRNYREYSGGIATDLFVHRITRLIRALDLTYPVRTVGMGGIYVWPDGRDLPDNMEMLLEYPAVEGVTPGLTMHILGTMANARGNKHCIRGHNATLEFTDKGWDIIEEGSGKVIESHTKTGAEDVALHHANHHAAIRNGAPLNCPPELGLYGVVAVCMGNDSWFKRRMMVWNPRKEAPFPA